MIAKQIHTASNQIRFFVSSIAICFSFIYLFSRAQMGTNHIYPVLYSLGVSMFLICFVDLIKKNSFAICINCLFLIIIAGFVAPFLSKYFLLFFILAGYISWFTTCYLFVRNNNLRTIIFLVIFSLFFSLWLSAMVWGQGFNSPFFFDSISTKHIHLDSLFNSAIMQMIETYGIPSTGLDGPRYINYHWGSNWIFAQISNLLKINPILFYQFCYQIIIIPFFFMTFLYFILQIKIFFKIHPCLNFRAWIFMAIGFIGFFPTPIIGVLDRILFFSESYLLSIIFSLILFTFMLSWIKHEPDIIKLFLVAPFLIILIGLTKISTAFLIACLALYLFLRLKLYKNKAFVLLFVIIVVILFSTSYFVATKYYSASSSISSFHFIKNYVLPSWKQLFLLYYYFVFFIYSFFRLKSSKITTLKDFLIALKNKKLVDLEILSILTIVGILPGNIISISEGGGAYFSDFPRWISLAFFLAFIPNILPTRRIPFSKKFPIRLIIIGFALLLFCSSIIVNNYKKSIMNLIYWNKVERGSQQIKKSQEMLQTLQSLYELNPRIKKESLIYIPFSNKDYWKMGDCLSTSFIAPAVTGMALINGMPGKKCNNIAFGYESYDEKSNVEDIQLQDPNNFLCRKAITMHFVRIFVLNTRFTKNINILSCK